MHLALQLRMKIRTYQSMNKITGGQFYQWLNRHTTMRNIWAPQFVLFMLNKCVNLIPIGQQRLCSGILLQSDMDPI